MTVLIGYVPTPVGEAALEAGLEEAAAHGDDVVLLNSPRRGSTVDGEFVDEDDRPARRRRRRAGVTALASTSRPRRRHRRRLHQGRRRAASAPAWS